MPLPRLALHRLAAVTLVVAACGRESAPRVRDSVAVQQAALPEPAATAPTNSGWLDAFGPVLLVVGDTASEAIVVPPDTSGAFDEVAAPATLAGRTVHLLDRAGEIAAVSTRPVQPPEPRVDCLGRPVLHLDAPQSPRQWTVGLLGGTLAPIVFDSVGSLARRDSATLVAEVARIASSLPSRDSEFAGLPFDVVDAERFTVDGRRMLLAYVVRRVNREANPLQERTLLIAEAGDDGRYTLAWHERSSAGEAEVEGNELLGGFLLDGRPFLLIARDASSGVSWSIVERTASGAWRVRWTGGGGVC